MVLAACGASQEELDAQATKVAAEIFSTQTAAAPTRTAMPTQTAMPTRTDTPAQPTETPLIALGISNITPRIVQGDNSTSSDQDTTADQTDAPYAVVDTRSLNVRKGPDTTFPIMTGVAEGDRLEIVGQAYTCAWLLIRTEGGVEGWVSASLVIYDMPCNEIASAPVPPTPASAASLPSPTTVVDEQPDATKAPSGKTVSVKIINKTGGTLSLNLSGPADYSFTFGTGTQNIKVVKGKYTYTAWGCGSSSSGSKALDNGDEWEWFCK
jgi:uncharacterized protein YraI